MSRNILIGVDVGGTNTDAVLLDPAEIKSSNKGVLAWNKKVTTSEVSDGIQQGISNLFDDCPEVNKDDVTSVTIGTTHFINAVVEQDQARLEKVAILRLCGPYSHNVPPFSDFPAGLKKILNGYTGIINGGYHVDGNEIQPVDEEEVLQHIKEIKARGLNAIAIVGIFSSLKSEQEIRVKEIVLREIPDARVVVSHQVSNIGFLERENASILNASILAFAEKIISSFTNAIKNLGLHCPVLLTQNDGTVLSAYEALSLPIKTFSSGATNSMRGASFLGDVQGKSSIVVDVGGTTADVGLLLPSGFPRQSSSYSTVGGVRMNFSMPHVESIGLGGGSIVRGEPGNLTVGPDSTGAEIVKRALLFGGSEVTASDVAVSIDQDEVGELDIGDSSLVKGKFSKEYQESFKAEVKLMLESVIDRMKTNPDDITVLAVGGGSFIVPEKLDGASSVIRPPFYSVANAIGAAMGKISSEVHSIKLLPAGGQTKEEVLEELKRAADQRALAKGALEDSIEVVYVSCEPVPYVPNTYEFFIKTIADVDYSKMKDKKTSMSEPQIKLTAGTKDIQKNSNFVKERIIEEEFDYISYKPFIDADRKWILTETDLEFLTIGCYILGSGGGGNPYSHFLESRNLLRQGDTMCIVDVDDVSKYVKGEGAIPSVGYAGSPTVSNEQLHGDALTECYNFMAKFIHKEPEMIFPLEIGGGNGFAAFEMSSSSRLNIPVVDCDLMGRAYPTHWQTIPVVYQPKGTSFYSPSVMSNGNGNNIILATSKSDLLMEKTMRASLAELGSTVGVMNPPMTAKDIETKTIHRSFSLAWRMGRAVKIARQKSQIDRLPEIILESVNNSGKLLFSGKIVGVERKLFKGHAWGQVIIEELEQPKRKMIIPFKNENIYCEIADSDGSNPQLACSVPDLIAVIDADTGEAVGTPDYRYGLLVFVLGIAPSDKWTESEEAIAIGGPKGFDLDIEYKPVSIFSKPLSVIQEFASK